MHSATPLHVRLCSRRVWCTLSHMHAWEGWLEKESTSARPFTRCAARINIELQHHGGQAHLMRSTTSPP